MSECLTRTTSFLETSVLADYRQFGEVSIQYREDAEHFGSSMQDIKSSIEELTKDIEKIAGAIAEIDSTINDTTTGVGGIAERTSEMAQETSDSIAKVESVVFDNVTLDSIVQEIAAYHHMDVDLQNEQARQLRFYFVWKQDDSLQEVMEKLNMFEPVNMTIENGKLTVR